MMEWQPIETAPETAKNVLAFSESGNMKIETGYWLRHMLHAAKVDGEHCNYTHWMPLPAPPLPDNAGAEPREASASGNLLYDTRKNT